DHSLRNGNNGGAAAGCGHSLASQCDRKPYGFCHQACRQSGGGILHKHSCGQRCAREGDAAPAEPIGQLLSPARESARESAVQNPQSKGGVATAAAFQIAQNNGSAILVRQAVELLIEEQPEIAPLLSIEVWIFGQTGVAALAS